MFRRLLLTGVVVGVVATAGFGSLQAREPASFPPGPWAGTPLGRLVSGNIGRLLVLRSEVNLTAAQREQVRQVLLSHKAEIAGTARTLHDKRVAVRTAVLSEKADEAQIRAAVDELSKVAADAAVKAAKLRGELAPILTPDQRQLVGKFLAERDATIDKFLVQATQGK